MRVACKLIKECFGHEDGVMCLTVFTDSVNNTVSVLSGGIDGTIKEWNPADGSGGEHLLKGHEETVNCILIKKETAIKKVAPPMAISCSDDKSIVFWDLRTKAQVKKLESHQSAVNKLVWKDENEEEFYSCDDEGEVRCWNVDSAAPKLTFHAGIESINAILYTNDALWTGGDDGFLRKWVFSEENFAKMDDESQSASTLVPVTNVEVINTDDTVLINVITKHANGNLWIAVGHRSLSAVQQRNSDTGALLCAFRASDWVRSIFFWDPDTMLTASDDGNLNAWDITSFIVHDPSQLPGKLSAPPSDENEAAAHEGRSEASNTEFNDTRAPTPALLAKGADAVMDFCGVNHMGVVVSTSDTLLNFWKLETVE
ncbi:F-box/WD repeat-containing protein pof1 [Diplonema papillatum]|nr:F-box/WD repeat-containing protein pof1 [Diplonema papillatum]